ncbi:MAG TPA: acyltransferase [Petrotogaceae bacterium]|nr:acyltransferase [Petrotogaceae bacterium]
MTSFYNVEELKEFGFAKVGINVLISRKASIYGAENMSIGSNVRIDDFCILSGKITIGNYVHIGAYSAIFGSFGVEMHDFSGISSRVSIYSSSDDYSGEYMTNPTVPQKYRGCVNAKVVLSKHVIVGAETVILPGVVIGEGTAVGSMCLVNRSCDEWSIYGGIPAKRIKERNRHILELEKELLKEKKHE